MCGVLGIVDRRAPVDAELARSLCDRMIHRGPDAGGVYTSADGRVALAHRRLSIRDLSDAANQPMAYRGLQLSYNGEIYNYDALRTQLEARGHRFRTHSDTEAILIAWNEWGEDSLTRLEGMFAFLLYEEESGRLHVVRDRLGIKPLYFHAGPDLFVAASELRSITHHPRVPREVDFRAIDEYLTYRYIPPPRTVWEGISKLAAGERLVVEGDTITRKIWWDLSANPDVEGGPSEMQARRELKERIEASVSDYLVSDVPVGVFLSGGWDSSVVTHFAKRHHEGELHAFSLGFDVESHSELELARAAARHYGVRHHETTIDGERARGLLDELADLFEEPWMASSALPMLAVARLAREEVTVALSGDGGDEIFGGYAWYRKWPQLRRRDFFATPIGGLADRLHVALRGAHREAWHRSDAGPVELFAELHGAIPEAQRRSFFGAEARAAVSGHDALHFFRDHYREDLPERTRLQYLDAKTFLPEMCLAKVDRTTMATSLEARTPLLNHELVEWAFSLPESVRNPGGELKGLLKASMAECVPDAVRNAPKKGFSAPSNQWFDRARFEREVTAYQQEHPEWAARLLAPDFLERSRSLSGPNRLKWWQLLRWARQQLD